MAPAATLGQPVEVRTRFCIVTARAGYEGAIEIARIDDAWPTHKSALWLAELVARDCDVWFDFSPICAEF
jgi:hypothetical protein